MHTEGRAVYDDMLSSGGRPSELTHRQIDQIRDWLHDDLYAFAVLIGGCDRLFPALHQDVCNIFQRWGQPDWKRLMLQLPRGSYKTTLVTRTGSLWLLCRDPNDTICIFSERVDNVKKWLRAIRDIVRGNLLFHALYRHMIPPGIAADDDRHTPKSWKWNDEEILFERDQLGIPEASITAMGLTAASTGGHWRRTIKDDIVSVEAAHSPSVMQFAKDWFDTSLYLGPSPEELNDLVVCTRWHYDDVYEYVRKKYNYKLYRRKALENGETIFPRLWSTAELLQMQENDPYNFSSQLQNDPAPGKDVSFDPRWIRNARLATNTIRLLDYDPHITRLDEYEDPPPPTTALKDMTKTLLVDPAPSEETERRRQPGARTAMVMRAVDPWGRRYTLDIWAGREDAISTCHRMIRMLLRWGTNRLGIEEVVFSKVYAPFVRMIARREYNLEIHYIPLQPGRRDKDTRIQGLGPSFQSGFEYVEAAAKPSLLEEYVAYPYGATRDILDAMAYSDDPGVLPRPESPEEHEWRQWEQYETDEDVDPCTGYSRVMD